MDSQIRVTYNKLTEAMTKGWLIHNNPQAADYWNSLFYICRDAALHNLFQFGFYEELQSGTVIVLKNDE